MRRRLTLVVLAAVATGCSLVGPPVCTQMGCVDGIRVDVVNPPDGPYTLALVVDGEVLQTVECGGGECPWTFFEHHTPAVATIVLESAEGAISQTFELTYERYRPNGPGCPPVCSVAAITFAASA